MSKVRFIGLDVHADTIAVAVAEPNGEVRSMGVLPNQPESIRKLVNKLGPVEPLRVCDEAGPSGYVIYWQLTALGVKCEVVAPTLFDDEKRLTAIAVETNTMKNCRHDGNDRLWQSIAIDGARRDSRHHQPQTVATLVNAASPPISPAENFHTAATLERAAV